MVHGEAGVSVHCETASSVYNSVHMQLYKIEKGIKVTSVKQEGSNGKASPVAATMQVLKKGESFLVTGRYVGKAAKVMRDFTTGERARGGKREFTSRTLDAGVRIWRVK